MDDDYEGNILDSDKGAYHKDRYKNKVLLDEDYEYAENLGPRPEIGMEVLHKEFLEEHQVIAWVDKHRDNTAVLYDSCGHSNWIDNIYNGDYYLVLNTVSKMRVVFGETSDSPLKVTEKHYESLEEFRQDTKHQGLAKMLYCTFKWMRA